MNNLLNTNKKKVIFFILVIFVIELSGHGIFASLFKFLSSIN